MNYKKNVISVILWLLSAIMAGTGAMMVTMPSAPEESQWIGLVIAGVWPVSYTHLTLPTT